jgi:hypothetical protein
MTNQTTVTRTTSLKLLNNGIQMPALGVGIYQSPRDQTAQAVEWAIASGYRLIDTAEAHGNGRAVRQALAQSSIPSLGPGVVCGRGYELDRRRSRSVQQGL